MKVIKKILSGSSLLALLLLLNLLTMPACAWKLYNGEDSGFLGSDTVVLEPDNWSREGLLAMRHAGTVPLAWLNLSQIEEWRLVPAGLRAKDYVFSGRYPPEGRKLAIFYTAAFRNLLRERLREYLLKGFSGVVFAKVAYFSAISNSPVNRCEMWRLIEELAAEARTLNPKALVLVHDAESFSAEIQNCQNIDGVVAEGLFYAKRGQKVRPWDRADRVNQLKRLVTSGKMVLIAEDARTEKRRKHVFAESARLAFPAAIVTLPMKIERKHQDGAKK